MKKKKRKSASVKKRVVKLSPEAPEARDEGPRLIPLASVRPEHPRVARFVQLADRLLETNSSAKKKS